MAMAVHDQEALSQQGNQIARDLPSSDTSSSVSGPHIAAQHIDPQHAQHATARHTTAPEKRGMNADTSHMASTASEACPDGFNSSSSSSVALHSCAQHQQAPLDTQQGASLGESSRRSEQQGSETTSGQHAPQHVQHQQARVPQDSHSSAEATPVAELPQGLISIKAGLAAIRQYLGSVGRYGVNTGALLTPMYGCGELPQAFCRCPFQHLQQA